MKRDEKPIMNTLVYLETYATCEEVFNRIKMIKRQMHGHASKGGQSIRMDRSHCLVTMVIL